MKTKIVPDEAALVIINEQRTLVVSDLHLGIEKELAQKGFKIPAYTLSMVERIRKIKESSEVNGIVVLGDVKHSVGKVQDIDWQVVPPFFETMLDMFSFVYVVPGNHDGNIDRLLPSRVRVFPSHGLVISSGRESIGLAHGHAWPSEQAINSGRLIIGHSHFHYEMRDKYGTRSKELVWVVARYKIRELASEAGYKKARNGTGKLIVMPPFNKIVGGQAINVHGSTEFGPVLSSRAVDIENAEIFMLDGTSVSKLYA